MAEPVTILSQPKRMARKVDEIIRNCSAFSGDPAKEVKQIPDDCVEDCPLYRRCWELQDRDPENTKNGMMLLEKVDE